MYIESYCVYPAITYGNNLKNCNQSIMESRAFKGKDRSLYVFFLVQLLQLLIEIVTANGIRLAWEIKARRRCKRKYLMDTDTSIWTDPAALRTHLNTIAKPTPLFSVCNLQTANCNPHTGIETGIVTHLHEICITVNIVRKGFDMTG